ncbi:PREDICTED: uncharacterized protein LOC106814015 [Priapulus caudatus]|uniref:Uncharacterized protein LOC106814015 n=1 Tax=Priapulus caudatus TaxID=37621 RepID=A0ABM1ENI6_PRICU|nr:PREDICTED: uncharacterized protein LOC106814015 [Priapulus caudatus]
MFFFLQRTLEKRSRGEPHHPALKIAAVPTIFAYKSNARQCSARRSRRRKHLASTDSDKILDDLNTACSFAQQSPDNSDDDNASDSSGMTSCVAVENQPSVKDVSVQTDPPMLQ